MILRHLRSSIVAYLALLIAMTGTSYAAAQIANGSVTTRKLANNAVVSSKISNEGVRSIDIRNNHIGSSDLRDNAVNSSDLQDGSVSSVDVKNETLVRADIADGVVPRDADVFVSSSPGTPPVAASTDAAGQHPFPFTMPRNGKVLLRFFAGELGVTCSDPTAAQVGLYLDGNPVAGTLTAAPLVSNAGAVELIDTDVLSQGAHTLAVGLDCPGAATISSRVESRFTWTVTLLSR